jgi:hypothetical protein
MFKGQNGWTAEGWRSITNKFNDMFPRANFSKQQVQEKKKELKGNYKVIKEARKSGRGGFSPSAGEGYDGTLFSLPGICCTGLAPLAAKRALNVLAAIETCIQLR